MIIKTDEDHGDQNFHLTAWSINDLASKFGLRGPITHDADEGIWFLDVYRMDALLRASFATFDRSEQLRRLEDEASGQMVLEVQA